VEGKGPEKGRWESKEEVMKKINEKLIKEGKEAEEIRGGKERESTV
jgi:hypothetical protein